MPQYKYFAEVRKIFQITRLLPKNAGGGAKILIYSALRNLLPKMFGSPGFFRGKKVLGTCLLRVKL